MQSKPKVVLILGAPGSGKGTQGKLIEENYGYMHLSMGDLMRKAKAHSVNIYNRELSTDNKTILTHEFSINFLITAMRENPVGKYVIDGFHRKFDEFDDLFFNSIDVIAVIHLKPSNLKILEDRIKDRYSKGNISNSFREYDLEAMEKRLKIYETETVPYVVEYFKGKSEIFEINCDESIDEVHKNTKIIMINILK